MTNGGFACAWQQGRGLPRRGERKEAGSQGDSHGSGKKRRLNFFYFLFFCLGSLLLGASTQQCLGKHCPLPHSSLWQFAAFTAHRGVFAITCESSDGGQWKRVLLGQESGHFLSLGASPMEALWATSAEEDIAGVRNTYTARILVGPHHSAGMCDKLGQWLFLLTAYVSHREMVASMGNLQRAWVGLTERYNKHLFMHVFSELLTIYFWFWRMSFC